MAWQRAVPPLVLASASEARRRLLAQAGLAFTVMPSRLDEAPIKASCRERGLDPGETALTLAAAKAAEVAACCPDHLVLGADQILSSAGVWFDKPPDLAAARAQLRQLSGRRQVLHTASVLWQGGDIVWRHLAEAVLDAREVSDAFLDAYVAIEGDALLASVGACRIEGPGQQMFRAIEGEHAAILGLPMLALLDALRDRGVLLS